MNPPAARIAAADLEILKGRFPHLADFSDQFLQSRTTDELLRIESTSLKLRDAERGRDAADRFHANKTALATRFTTVQAGMDNRWTVLHPARFLGGVACTAQQLWSMARSVIELTGHPLLSNYDLTAVGLGGFATSKGRIELGKPRLSENITEVVQHQQLQRKGFQCQGQLVRPVGVRRGEGSRRVQTRLEGPQDGGPIRVPMEHEFPGARGFPDPDGFLQAGVGVR